MESEVPVANASYVLDHPEAKAARTLKKVDLEIVETQRSCCHLSFCRAMKAKNDWCQYCISYPHFPNINQFESIILCDPIWWVT